MLTSSTLDGIVMLTMITFIHRLIRVSRPLMMTSVSMLVVLAGALVGLAVDDRIITGAPAWLKPAKFAASISIYTMTLAWIFTFIPGWTNTRRIVGWTTALTLISEIVIICLQASRGTTSHFNVSSPFDGVLFAVMGVAIVVQTLSVVAVAVALWREPFAHQALGWALRLGVVLTIVGGFTGGLMTRMTSEQREAVRTGTRVMVVGAHTVGAPDGGPGLPGTGWSTDHGDVRVPHFVGLHAMQVLPILAIIIARRRLDERVQLRLVLTASTSYAALFVILLTQALRGQSVLRPDMVTIGVVVAWIFLTAGAAWISGLRPRAVQYPATI